MKNTFIIIFVLIIITIETELNITNIRSSDCSYATGETVFTFLAKENLTENTFDLILEDRRSSSPISYSANCTKNIHNQKEGTCRMGILSEDFYFNQYHLVDKKSENYNASYTIKKCDFKIEDKDEPFVNITYRQICNFTNENQVAKFNFIGLISSENKTKNDKMVIYVNLIKDGFKEKKVTMANCFLTEDIIGVAFVKFSCTIENVTDDITSLVYYFSENVTGVPNDDDLLNPILTDKLIEAKKISLINTSKPIDNIFNIELIRERNCDKTGRFRITGKMTKPLNKSLGLFELHISHANSIYAECVINETNKTESVNIYCKTYEEFENQPIVIMDNLINDGKNDVLFIKKFMNKSISFSCANGKKEETKQKMKNENTVIFRQLNNFVHTGDKNYSFFFAGLTKKPLPENLTITINVYPIGEKSEKEVNCILVSQIKSENGKYAQADFNCSFSSDETIEDIEIFYSDNIIGIEGLKDYQKKPKETSQKIKDTKDEEGTGKVLDYSQESNKNVSIPYFSIESMNFIKCSSDGLVKLKGKFDKNNDIEYDFEIPLTYPSSSIKCKAPVTTADTPVTIECKIQKEFSITSKKDLIIESNIILQKNKEIFFVEYYNQSIDSLECISYEKKLLETSEQKYKADFTLLQTNNFIKKEKGISFNIILLIIDGKINSEKVPIKIKYQKSSRNLQEEDEIEEDIICSNKVSNEKENIKSFECNSEKINLDKNEIEYFKIVSNDISGINEDMINPIETDKKIEKGEVFNYSDPILLKELNIKKYDGELKELDCSKDGIFKLVLSEVNKNRRRRRRLLENQESFEINYNQPPDNGALCHFLDPTQIQCKNKGDFDNKEVKIDNQIINIKKTDNEVILLNKLSLGTKSWAANSNYYQKKSTPSNNESNEEPNPPNTDINPTDSTDSDSIDSPKIFLSKKSSSGLSGGAIAAIIIVSILALVAAFVAVVLAKKGVIGSKNKLINSTLST